MPRIDWRDACAEGRVLGRNVDELGERSGEVERVRMRDSA